MVETATTFQTDTSDGSSYSEITSKIQKDSLRLKSDSFQIDFEYSQEQKSTLKSKDESISKVEKLRKLTHIEQNGAIIPHVKLAWAILYIQMKLCQKTLRNFLDERNVSSSFEDYYSRFFYSHHKMSNEKIVLKMFLQMCSGLSYIHNKGIVHHDIKPSNVFITNEDNNSNLSLQLGDFGLACPLESTQNNNEVDVKHNGFGTRLYAAPEQLSGICNKKSDIYSMGVILIELLKKCLTVMECYKNIQTIKKGEVVPEIGDDLCKGLIKNLLDPVENRPSIENLSDIIRDRINLSNNEVEHLKRVISQRDDEIQQKDQTIEQLRNEILSLKKQLSTDDIKKCEIVLDQ
jgi:eukaryotic translation initiation factor 2-alpha kinase 1